MKNISIIAISGLASGVAFWLLWGHNLHMDYFSGGEFQFEKELSMQGKIIVTAVIGITVSIIVSGYFVVQYFMRMIRKNVAEGSVIKTTEY